ncbi:MAG: hypothetical protein HYU56_03845 [Candidatus Aenigmarchaeota archaeon]|nr:hypothetical protein [Candidatus Aenigmarchaeota archaeon]
MIKGLTVVSAIFALLLVAVFAAAYVLPASAQIPVQGIVAELKLSPDLTFCGATNNYTVEVRTLSDSAPIRSVWLFNGTYLPGRYLNITPHNRFDCGGAPENWTLIDHPGGNPFCQYIVNVGHPESMIQPGGSLNFTFIANTTTQSNYAWSVEVYNNGETWQPINLSITVDCTAPVTNKTFIGPFVEGACYSTASPPVVPPVGCRNEWIDGVTQVNLSAADDAEHNSGVNRTYWRNTLVDDEYCRNTAICELANDAGDFHPGNFNLYTGPFYKTEESCHLLEFYSVDNVGNNESEQRGVNTNCFFVDKTPPVVEKEVGEPSVDKTNEEEVNNGWVMWSTSDKHSGTSAAKLYVLDGTQDWAGVDVPVDIALQDITSLSFWQLIESYNPNGYDVNVVLGVDADGDGVFESDLDAWHIGGLQHNPAALGDDTFIEMDGPSANPVTDVWSQTDAYNTPQWWSPNEDKDGLSSDCYETLPNIFSLGCVDKPADLDPTDHVKLIKLQIGGSGSWNDETALVDELSLNGGVILDDITQDRFTWVTPATPITFTCTDPQPHPSGDEQLCFKVSFDQSPFDLTSLYAAKYETTIGQDGFACVPVDKVPVDKYNQFIFNFNPGEDSLHDLEYYCKDAVEKKSETFLQWYKVDDTPPTIEKDMFGSWLGDCPSGSDIEHGDCYVADNGHSGVTVTPVDAGLHKNSVSCQYEVWWHTDEYTCKELNNGYYDGGRCRLPDLVGSGGFSEPVDIVFVKDSTHDLEIFCQDMLGNTFYDTETFLVDSTPPVTTKTYGKPLFTYEDWCVAEAEDYCDEYEWENGDYENCLDEYVYECLDYGGGQDPAGHWMPVWINSSTPVTLEAGDNKVGVDKTYWRNFLAGNDQPCQQSGYCNPEFFDYYSASGTNDDVDVGSAAPEILEKNGGGSVYAFSPALTGPADFDTDYYYGVHAESDAVAADVHWEITVTSDGGSLAPGDVQLEEVGWYDPFECSIISPPGGCPNLGSETYVFASDGSGGLAASGGSGWSVASGEDFNNVDRVMFASGAPAGKYTVKRQLVNTATDEVLGEWTQKVVVGWNVYTGPFTKDEESCHVIEYYSSDKLGNTEEPKRQCVFVENTPPDGTKEVGEPKLACEDNLEPEGFGPEGFGPASVGDVVHQLDASEFDNPGYTNFCSIGLAFDGASLYYNRCVDKNIYKVHPVTGALQDTFDTGVSSYPNAMAFDAKRNGIWFGTQRGFGGSAPGDCGEGMPIYFWDFGDDSVALVFTVPSSLINPATGGSFLGYCFLDGLAYNENDPESDADDELWFSDDVNKNLGVFRPDGTLVTGYDATDTDEDLSSLSGLAIGGANLYMGNDGGGKVFRADKDTLDLVDQFVSEDDRQEDMECDPVTFNNEADGFKEVMWVRTTPQSFAEKDLITAFEIEPGTCGTGGQSAYICGNGELEVGEDCDDGNTEDGDSCPANCQLAPQCDWLVSQETPITLSCEDQDPHPVDHESVCFLVSFDDPQQPFLTEEYCEDVEGEIQDNGYCCVDRPRLQFNFQEDTMHDLEYYCEDALGNVNKPDLEFFAVDTQPPVITKTVVGPQVGTCPPEEEGDECIIDGVTKIHVEAEDPQPHPSNHVTCDWSYEVVDDDGARGGENDVTPTFDINFPEESEHELTITCHDALGNEVTDVETFLVDKTPPVTEKTYGKPFFSDDGIEWITIKTDVTLSATDDYGPHDSGVDATFWRSTPVDDTYCNGENFIDDDDETNDDLLGCEDAPNGTTAWNTYTNPFTINEESCHLIEFYSIDNVEKNETPRRQCAFVDDTPPVPIKTVEKPKSVINHTNTTNDYKFIFYPEVNGLCFNETDPDSLDCWKVTTMTPITLDCSDPEPHPVDNSNACFKVDLDGDDATEGYCSRAYGEFNKEDGFCCVIEDRAPVQFHFTEESEHNLKFYCQDALGNKGPVDEEKFKVEGRGFEIQLNKKWNLISTPLVLLNDSMDRVFEDIEENVTSVSTYDPVAGQWLVWTPDDATDTLHTMVPGWGYWVLMNDDNTLLIGGSLFSPVVTPPSKALKEGWNLIGYYGLNANEDKEPIEPPVYDGPDGDGRKSTCALGTLVNTALGHPKWDSLLTYWELFNPADKKWPELNFTSHMDPGAGYWLDIDEDELYSYSTTCPIIFGD